MGHIQMIYDVKRLFNVAFFCFIFVFACMYLVFQMIHPKQMVYLKNESTLIQNFVITLIWFLFAALHFIEQSNGTLHCPGTPFTNTD